MSHSLDSEVLIVGAGWSGMYALHRLRKLGLNATVLEAAEDVGGTWFWNRYPGARCDIESLHYSYSFDEDLQEEWTWSERYAAQPELLSYARHVADRFDLRKDIRFGVWVESAEFDESTHQWTLSTSAGQTFTSRFLIMATGSLSAPKTPDIPGLENFRGEIISTFDWPEEKRDFSGQRVAVIGTGSSGIQVIPELAKTAEELFIFQRTPSYSLPAFNRPLSREESEEFKRSAAQIRAAARDSLDGLALENSGKSALEISAEEREEIFSAVYNQGSPFKFQGIFTDQMFQEEANRTAADFVAAKIAERVDDPDIARALTPTSYPIATRRLCIDTNYYETYNRDNVTLVDLLSDPLTQVTEQGLQTEAGLHEVDIIVLATGFDAITGALSRIDIRGTGGRLLREKWADKISTYLGLMINGYPNLFTVTGPLSPSVLSNMMVSLEHHVEWITDCIAHLDQQGLSRIEASAEAEAEWGEHVNEVAAQTLFPQANSWYMGANVAGKSRQILPYVGGVGNYRRRTLEIAADGYRGFELQSQPSVVIAN
ncbi:Phenylacetone monooxygenase [Corynebacterium occultum]|uniref:Phenylacetone monooxygenase n=1 Tax=Corynebacterium occultum TaxID=2675219 RepID=A0A6B8W5J6_9CORY|nr:NAD(P)/FAD-dependent oxidoreductase [Corynebacterium occultum]QGU06595.1 Phenylacetone monooxygenase [Corynebacterium occultum]